MKKLLTFQLSAAIVFSLAACGSGSASPGAGESMPPVSSTPETSAPSETPEETPVETPDAAEPSAGADQGETGGTLVAYFSWSSNTEQVAQIIAEGTGGDLFEITPAVP